MKRKKERGDTVREKERVIMGITDIIIIKDPLQCHKTLFVLVTCFCIFTCPVHYICNMNIGMNMIMNRYMNINMSINME
jgi:hypothetical protein